MDITLETYHYKLKPVWHQCLFTSSSKINLNEQHATSKAQLKEIKYRLNMEKYTKRVSKSELMHLPDNEFTTIEVELLK